MHSYARSILDSSAVCVRFSDARLSALELRAEIEQLQKVLFSDTATDKEKEDANIKLEKAIQQYEQTPEAKDEVRRRKEERRLRNESLNRDALARMKEVRVVGAA